jgi:hypothetical protein
MATCHGDSDCRTGDGYVCRTPGTPGVSAVIIDSNTSQRVCMLAPDPQLLTPPSDTAPPVCPGVPNDASAELLDTGVQPGADGAADSGPGGTDGGDAGKDGASDGMAPPVDASADVAGEASADAGADAGPDAAAGDASTGDAADTGSD